MLSSFGAQTTPITGPRKITFVVVSVFESPKLNMSDYGYRLIWSTTKILSFRLWDSNSDTTKKRDFVNSPRFYPSADFISGDMLWQISLLQEPLNSHSLTLFNFSLFFGFSARAEVEICGVIRTIEALHLSLIICFVAVSAFKSE